MAKHIFSVNLDSCEPKDEKFQQYLIENNIGISPDPYKHKQESYDFFSSSREALENMINKFWIDQKQEADFIKEEQEFLFSFIEQKEVQQ